MKRTLLLTSAAVALTLGLTPALAQDHTDSKTKRDPAATERRDQNINHQAEKTAPEHGDRHHNAAANERTGTRSTTGQASPDGKQASPDSKAASDNPTAAETKSGTPDSDKATKDDVNKSSTEPKRAEENNKTPSTKAANKSDAATPSKNAAETNTRSPEAQKSTQSSESNRNARTSDSNRNAETNTPKYSAAESDRSGSPKTRVSASLDSHKKTELHSAIAKIDARPVTNVNFSVSVGTVVPHTVSLRPLPSTIVEIVPQYRGYDFMVVRDEVVIVEPHTHKIVDVIERGPSRARAETTTSRPRLTAEQREVIRRHASTKRRVTTGTATRTTTEVTVGERLPDSVEVESFPEEVYREVPEVREYRYIERGDDVYLVDPSDRRVIEEIR